MPQDVTVRDALKRIGEDLFAIEVNTIVKPTMTAARFPGAAHAILDIASEYDCYLLEFVPTAVARRTESKEERKVNTAYFDDIRVYAEALLPDNFQEPTPTRQRLLRRILDNSDQLKAVLARNSYGDKSDPLTRTNAIAAETRKKPLMDDIASADLVIIRKIWEVGLEEIAMQTVVHLDGDIITRLQPQYVKGDGAGLVALHERSTNLALGFWKSLVDIAREVVTAAIGIVKT